MDCRISTATLRSFIQNYHLAVKYHELIPVKKNSMTDKVSLKDNLIIHGDNLKALKALLPTYAGKVKCIYIDPPYNTGNEGWAYNDNVNSPMMQEWLGKVVDREDLTRHDKWLCMMMPRLKLLKELLHPEEGIIFVSVDDNELYNLRLLMDEVFQSENWFATLTRRAMHTVRNSSKDFNLNTDYVLVYAKAKSWHGMLKSRYIRIPMDKTGSYPNDDDDGKGPYKLDPISARNFYTTYDYVFKNGVKWTAPAGSYPRYSEDTLAEMENAGEIVFTGKEPKAKRYLRDVQEGRPPDALLSPEDVGFNSSGTTLLRQIMGGGKFPQPKPIELIKYILQMIRDKNALVLDSFAGSGTTAHAVLDLNKEDGGNRKFILVECEDYADSITAERIRRVIKGVPDAKEDDLRNGLGGSFSFFELGEPIELENILEGSRLPSYLDLARYVFYTATGEEFLPEQVDEDKHFIGESREYEVYLFYKPDLDYLKSTALTLDIAKTLGEYTGKKKLVFAPTKYLDLNDSELLAKHGLKGIEYCQLPFEIYKLRE
ncbi:MAG: site-specific DNA-methyltransferase [Chloroflexi bacterium]|nr:site-specific DNA-methyltransferase [Chloroflexota bacterium]